MIVASGQHQVRIVGFFERRRRIEFRRFPVLPHRLRLRLIFTDRHFEHAIAVGLARSDALPALDDLDFDAGARFARFAVNRVNQHLAVPIRVVGCLVDHRQVGDDGDGVSAQIAVDGFDQINARLAFAERDHPRVVFVLGRRQHLPPRTDKLVGIEQRHARVIGHVQRQLLARTEFVVERGARFAAQLAAKIILDRASDGHFERTEVFQSRRLALDGRGHFSHVVSVFLAHLVRAVELFEKPERVSDLINAEVERSDSLIADVDARVLACAVSAIGRKLKARLDCRAWLRTRGCGRRRSFSASNVISQGGQRNRRGDDSKIDKNNGAMISEFHSFTSPRLTPEF
ncbi:MAG: hypothetical protein JMDDDDMK_01655 [Acidobacteria bacterium]|nr:hypothetical protein [Acidobacteriota bacterium]